MRFSRSRAASACARIRWVRLLMTMATRNMIANVRMCRRSVTAKVKYGGTKKKSNDRTPRTAARREGPYPNRIATMTMPRSSTMTTSASCSQPKSFQESAVATAMTATLAT